MRGMLVNENSINEENFWPSITQTPDGRVSLREIRIETPVEADLHEHAARGNRFHRRAGGLKRLGDRLFA